MKNLYITALSNGMFYLAAVPQRTIFTTVPIGHTTPSVLASQETAVKVPVNISGENVTWDCSNLEPHPMYQVVNIEFSSPAGTPHYSEYPNPNYYWTDPELLPFIGHQYIQPTTDSLAWWGMHVAGESYYTAKPDVSIYPNPFYEYKILTNLS